LHGPGANRADFAGGVGWATREAVRQGRGSDEHSSAIIALQTCMNSPLDFGLWKSGEQASPTKVADWYRRGPRPIAPSHGENRGSSPLGSASDFNSLSSEPAFGSKIGPILLRGRIIRNGHTHPPPVTRILALELLAAASNRLHRSGDACVPLSHRAARRACVRRAPRRDGGARGLTARNYRRGGAGPKAIHRGQYRDGNRASR
jgi:hypothetical protein